MMIAGVRLNKYYGLIDDCLVLFRFVNLMNE